MASLFDDLDDFNDDGSEGERLRNEAFDLFRRHRPALVRRLQRAFLQHILDHGPSTSDALRALVEIPPGVDPRIVGYAVRTLSFDFGLTRRVNSAKTRRKIAHRRDLQVWDTLDAVKAHSWLQSNPDYASGTNRPPTGPDTTADPTDPFN